MSLTPFGSSSSWDPFRRMHHMMNEMERSFFEPYGLARSYQQPSFDVPPSMMGGATFGMRLDIQETDKGFELSADLPGMRKEDITVDVDQDTNILTVAGQRKQEREETNEGHDGQQRYRYMERSFGKASRSIRLPETADVSKGSASYDDGVLKLSFPKREALPSTRTKIPITSGQEGGKL